MLLVRLLLLAASLSLATGPAAALAPPPPLPKNFPLGQLIADRDGNLLVASGFDGLYRRGHADVRWHKALDLPAHARVRLQDDGEAGWFVTADVALPGQPAQFRSWRSTDAGLHWRLIPAGGWTGSARGRLYACGNHQQFMSSADGGSTWQTLGTLPIETCNLVLAASTELLYVSSGNGDFARSEDGGRHWTRLPLPAGMPALYLGPRGVLYAGGEVPDTRPDDLRDGAFWAVSRSDDQGSTWQREWFGEPDHVRAMCVAAANDRFVVVSEGAMASRPARTRVRDASRTGPWTPEGYRGDGSHLPEHANDSWSIAGDHVERQVIALDGGTVQQGPDLAGLPDEDTGRPRPGRRAATSSTSRRTPAN